MHKIFLIGSQYHCDMVKGFFTGDEGINFTCDIKKADLLYAVYGPGITWETIPFWLFTNKPVLIHWIGKDTFLFHKDKKPTTFYQKIKQKAIMLMIGYRNVRHSVMFLSSAPWLANEVSVKSKIPTEYFVLTSIEPDKLLPPSKTRLYDFMSYIPVNDFDMYFGNELLRIVEESPERRFCIVCPDLLNADDWPYKKHKNLVIQPRTNKEGFYKILNNTKVFIRMKAGGDAIALSVLEALAHGCKVVWNQRFDFCWYDERESFLSHYGEYFIDDFEINQQAVDFVKQNYSVSEWKRTFITIINGLLRCNK